jgi:hypothetical protein
MIDLANYADGKRQLLHTEASMAELKIFLAAEIKAGRIEPESRCRPYSGAPKGDGWGIEPQTGHVEPNEKACYVASLLLAAQQGESGEEPEGSKRPANLRRQADDLAAGKY